MTLFHVESTVQGCMYTNSNKYAETLPVNFEIYRTGPMVFASPSAQPTTQNGSAVPIFPTWLSILVKDSQIDEMVTLSIVLVFLIAFVLIDILRPIHFRIGQKVITQLQFSFRRIRATNWVIVGRGAQKATIVFLCHYCFFFLRDCKCTQALFILHNWSLATASISLQFTAVPSSSAHRTAPLPIGSSF